MGVRVTGPLGRCGQVLTREAPAQAGVTQESPLRVRGQRSANRRGRGRGCVGRRGRRYVALVWRRKVGSAAS